MDFFEKLDGLPPDEDSLNIENPNDAGLPAEPKSAAPDRSMTAEELFEMRKKILPQL